MCVHISMHNLNNGIQEVGFAWRVIPHETPVWVTGPVQLNARLKNMK